jgi:hypothetical protein
MKTLGLLHHLPAWILAAACGLALLPLASAPVAAQSNGTIVDVCSSGSYSFVDSYIFYGDDNVTIEETACISGDASELSASASADQTCCGQPVYDYGEDMQVFDNQKLIADTGIQARRTRDWNSPGICQTPTSSTATSTYLNIQGTKNTG